MTRDQALTGPTPTFGPDELCALLEGLAGQPGPLKDNSAGLLAQVSDAISNGQCIGYSQFNELLLNVGYDRVDRAFFLFLCDPDTVSSGAEGVDEISSATSLKYGIEKFRQLALLLYGNVKFGFKSLSRDTETLLLFVRETHREKSDRDFRSRHDPLVPLEQIDSDATYLLGYISGQEIDEQLRLTPDDPPALRRKEEREKVIEKGRWNHDVYLTYDHLDVYVATSMRERHEYAFVSKFISKFAENAHVKELKLRVFDPTLAYCKNRIDKGLAEALMLKRAACTIYLAQESDTLGKDSELASTLAQGKPVIAFVPKSDDEFWNYLYETFGRLRPSDTDDATLIRMLKIYEPDAAWIDDRVRAHLTGKTGLESGELLARTRDAVAKHYDKRASVLKNVHPLGLQTNLNTGVANGVLVARNIDDCAKLVRRILLNKMEFRIDTDGDKNVLLNETITGCTFRVMTADRLLTNSFWNFYNVV